MISSKKLDDFLSDNRISAEQWEASQLKWAELVEIGIDYEAQVPHLEATAGLMASTIQRFSNVHSVRWRVKDVEHLLAKIVRKRAQGSEKYLNLNVENYGEVITDLIGMRALHLFKSDFSSIHADMEAAFTFAETPIVYVREGDNPELKELYFKAGFNVQVHPQGYRSIHYVAITQPLKRRIHLEIQVRTIFEEGWSEIDHTIRYPNFSDNVQIAYLLTIFNRMAGSADEVGDFVKSLAHVLDEAQDQINAAIKEKDESVAKMEAALEQLAAEKGDKKTSDQISVVQDELQKLKKNSSPGTRSAEISQALQTAKLVSTGLEIEKIHNMVKTIEDPSGIKAALKAMNDPGGVLAQMKAIDDPGGIKAAMKAIDDPAGIKAALKAMNDPGGIYAQMKAIEDLGGINSLLKKAGFPPK